MAPVVAGALAALVLGPLVLPAAAVAMVVAGVALRRQGAHRRLGTRLVVVGAILAVLLVVGLLVTAPADGGT